MASSAEPEAHLALCVEVTEYGGMLLQRPEVVGGHVGAAAVSKAWGWLQREGDQAARYKLWQVQPHRQLLEEWVHSAAAGRWLRSRYAHMSVDAPAERTRRRPLRRRDDAQ